MNASVTQTTNSKSRRLVRYGILVIVTFPVALGLVGAILAWQKLAFDSAVADAREKIQQSGGRLFKGRRSALGLIRISHHDPTLNAEKLSAVMVVARKLDEHGWVTNIELDFRDSGIRDPDIHLLQGLKKLKEVDLSITPVTDQGVSELASLYPQVKIVTNSVTSYRGK